MNKVPIFSLFVVSVILVFVFGKNLPGTIGGWFLYKYYVDISDLGFSFWSLNGNEVIKFLISVVASVFFYRKLKNYDKSNDLGFLIYENMIKPIISVLFKDLKWITVPLVTIFIIFYVVFGISDDNKCDSVSVSNGIDKDGNVIYKSGLVCGDDRDKVHPDWKTDQ
tara:strand:+ start:700 stop:1197 length:498 start_codon:yes stop_codon:yes gene_type:complete